MTAGIENKRSATKFSWSGCCSSMDLCPTWPLPSAQLKIFVLTEYQARWGFRIEPWFCLLPAEAYSYRTLGHPKFKSTVDYTRFTAGQIMINHLGFALLHVRRQTLWNVCQHCVVFSCSFSSFTPMTTTNGFRRTCDVRRRASP